MKNNLLALAGAAAGGALGYFAFFWIAQQGFYALVLPGGLLGLGAGVVLNRSIVVAIVCCLAATALGIFTEFRFRPFIKDDSFPYFISHVFDLQPITLIMIALGGFVGFWVPFRRREPSGRMV
jgi:hypothetical protein